MLPFQYRGMHLDVASIFPSFIIKKYIDYLAAYKYNTFHWHLTDDRAGALKKKYPLLRKRCLEKQGPLLAVARKRW